jgi:hypothetical protein
VGRACGPLGAASRGSAPSREPGEKDDYREGKATTLDEAIAELYRREVSCGCETFFDAGITLWIGDQTNGRYSETQLPKGRFGEAEN